MQCQGSCFGRVSLGDWVMSRTVENAGMGFRWKITPTLEDLDFAEDLALISCTFTHFQKKIDCLYRNGKGTDLKNSTKKTKLTRIIVKNTNAVVEG